MNKKTSKVLAKLLEIGEVQRLHFRLMEIASFNEFDGLKVVKDLLVHRDLWQACIMDREGYCLAEAINKYKTPLTIDLIKLRDMGDHTTKRLSTQAWNVSTLFILAPLNSQQQKKLMKLAKTWKADEVDWIDSPQASHLLGSALNPTARILRVWWG